ncbi:MAG: glycosyltransferase family 39 protein, partial [Halalkalicoccus sp.]|nr:glycosyltransferase family 39 protein [Halalkalicoccus sp.]
MADEYGRSEREESETLSVASILDEERFWLVVSVLAGSLVVAGYFLNKPYPAYATALFPHMAEVLIENGYRRPEVIPLYTAEGLPFAYPPLMFYVMAVLIDVGIDPLLISRLLPGVAFVLLLVPYFYLSREFLSVRQAGVATVVFATAPQITRWHISGGGAVRSPAVLFLLIGLYVGVRLFKTGDRRWVLPGAVLYGLTMLTHPVQMAYFGISYLVLFAAFDRSVRGLLHGAGVALGGAIVGAPWWLYVV